MKNNIIYITDFITKKNIEKELIKDNRTPLFKSHLNNTDFIDRLARIRSSLEKINYLLKEPKQNSNDK